MQLEDIVREKNEAATDKDKLKQKFDDLQAQERDARIKIIQQKGIED